MSNSPLLLGIDVGTTKVAAVVVTPEGAPMAEASRPHEADRPASPGYAEQCTDALLEAIWRVVRELPRDVRRQVRAVGVAGQMHGVVVLDAGGNPLTPLVTWEDQRCLEGPFLDDLNRRTGHRMRTGFGCSTLAWSVAHDRLPVGAAGSCTIHDLVVARLCGMSRPVTDATGGAGWGLFDLGTLDWDAQAVRASGIPPAILPDVLPCGARAGCVCEVMADALSLSGGIPVTAAIGDNQASILATLEDEDADLIVTLGTGGQASAVLPAGREPSALDETSTFDLRPYPRKRYVVVAPLLAGGSAWAWLAETVEEWSRTLGREARSRDELFRRLNELGLEADDALTVKPHFLGERCDASLKASIEGIDPGNFTLGNVARALARGIAENLRDMLPAEALAGRRRIVGSGNALRRNPLLQKMMEQAFGLPLHLGEGREEAARGAGMLAGRLSRGSSSNA